MNNQNSTFTFVLLQFSEVREEQILYFALFLAFYLTSLTGNLLLITAVAFDHRLHTPMYIFLTNLAVLNLGSTSAIIPKTMSNILKNSWTITYSECVTQLLFFYYFGSLDLALLTVMAYDRFVSICNPLHYERIMHKRACIQISIFVWVFGVCYASLHTAGTFANTFCSNIIHQFFCEIPALLKISCTDMYLVEVSFLVVSCCLALGCCIYILITYMHIFSTVLKIPSVRAKKKALSTCLPHLVVVSVFTSTVLFAHAKLPTAASSDLDVFSAVIYTMVPPMLNPFIYSVRNKEIKGALWNLVLSLQGKNIAKHL